MEAQQAISLRKNQALVGQRLQVLIEGNGEAEDAFGNTEPISAGRARRHAPEVDGLVFVPGIHPIGSVIDVEIAEATEYDLWAADDRVAVAVTTPAGRRRQRPRINRKRRSLPMAKLPGT
jgi:ribosomal protein S12 methylthiotransferase